MFATTGKVPHTAGIPRCSMIVTGWVGGSGAVVGAGILHSLLALLTIIPTPLVTADPSEVFKGGGVWVGWIVVGEIPRSLLLKETVRPTPLGDALRFMLLARGAWWWDVCSRW